MIARPIAPALEPPLSGVQCLTSSPTDWKDRAK
jgi:hypothetical protein